MTDRIYTRLQSDRAPLGKAAGQCAECGSFRADGQPPILHRDNCSHTDDWITGLAAPSTSKETT